MRLLIDADLLLEILLNRDKIAQKSDKIWQLTEVHKIEGFITEIAFDKAYRICDEITNSDISDKILTSLLSSVSICPINESLIRKARLSTLQDFESALEVACAKNMDLDGVVTHHMSNFDGSNSKVFSIEELLANVDSEEKIATNQDLLEQLARKPLNSGSVQQVVESKNEEQEAIDKVKLSIKRKSAQADEYAFALGSSSHKAAVGSASNPANDILQQAHQSNVAAIIQVLNDKLADSGVRTRAIFANDVLHLLCEAPTAEQLEQTYLIDRIRQTLESISPKNIRRVNINSRLVREQQLLWLDEIHRDPDGQVLWSKEISLKCKNIFRQSAEEWREAFSYKDDFRKPLSVQAAREKRWFAKGVFGGLGISAAVLAASWGVYSWQTGALQIAGLSNLFKGSSAELAGATPKELPQAKLSQDPFAVAVRLAEKASATGRNAQTPQQKQEIADMWDKASNLMASVPASDKRYAIAQDRTVLYRKHKESILEGLE